MCCSPAIVRRWHTSCPSVDEYHQLFLRWLRCTCDFSSYWSTYINLNLVSEMFSGTEFRYVLVVTSGTCHSANFGLSSSMSTSSSCDVICVLIPRAVICFIVWLEDVEFLNLWLQKFDFVESISLVTVFLRDTKMMWCCCFLYLFHFWYASFVLSKHIHHNLEFLLKYSGDYVKAILPFLARFQLTFNFRPFQIACERNKKIRSSIISHVRHSFLSVFVLPI